MFSLCGMIFQTITLVCTWYIALMSRNGTYQECFNSNVKGGMSYGAFVSLILVFVVLGGIGNIRGSMIAAVILTVLPEILRGLSDYRMLIYAIVLIAMMLFNWAPAAITWKEKMKAKMKSKSMKEAK